MKTLKQIDKSAPRATKASPRKKMRENNFDLFDLLAESTKPSNVTLKSVKS